MKSRAQHLRKLKRQRTRQVLRIVARAGKYKLQNDPKQMMQIIGDGFLELGGIYVKFLQGVLMQHPMMKDWKSASRFSVYERVAPAPLDIASFLHQELPTASYRQISHVSDKPFAAGSFGQVYHGRLFNGQEVIIKVLRPRSQDLLHHDLKLIHRTKALFAGVFTSWDADFKSALRAFEKTTLAEADYVQEQAFAQELYQSFADHQFIVIPRTYSELCTPSVIVQDFVPGLSAAELLEMKENGTDATEYVRLQTGSNLRTQLVYLGSELLGHIFTGKPVHGDLHPGNIRFLSGDRVGLIDFGIIAQGSRNPHRFYQLMKQYWLSESKGVVDVGGMFRNYLQTYANDLYQSLSVVSKYFSERNGQPINFGETIAKIAEQLFFNEVDPERMKELAGKGVIWEIGPVSDRINRGNRFGLKAKLEDPDMLRGWQIFSSVAIGLTDRHIIPEIYNSVMEWVYREHPELEQQEVARVGLYDAMEYVLQWLERVAQNDPFLFQQMVDKLRLSQLFQEKASHTEAV